ncbi:MAG: c-type cytochrome [Caldilineaceae bacterium]|nr:c-type cytochrome [Caldilineaceae bacterium]
MSRLSAQGRIFFAVLGIALILVILMGLQDRPQREITPFTVPTATPEPAVVEEEASPVEVVDEPATAEEEVAPEEATPEEELVPAEEEAEGTESRASFFFAVLPSTPPIPEDNPQTPEKEELGKMLYFEPRLSQSSVIACSTCHNLGLGGTDRIPTSLGHDFQTGGRNAPTVLNAAFFNQQFWDGRAASLEEQAQGPIQAGVEMAMPADMAVERIKGIAGYLPYFQAAFPGEEDPITFDNIAKAIAAFERTLITPNDPLDRYLLGDDDALSPLAKKGMETFEAVNCVACHNGPMLSSGLLMRFRHGEDPGRMTVTGDPADEFLFRVPTLRNLPLTSPYFHDGSAATIEEAINTMANVQLNRELTPEEVEAISAFLNSLVGEQPQVTVPILPAN